MLIFLVFLTVLVTSGSIHVNQITSLHAFERLLLTERFFNF